MAAKDLDVLASVPRLLEARPPGHHTVSPRVDGSDRHVELVLVRRRPAGALSGERGVGKPLEAWVAWLPIGELLRNGLPRVTISRTCSGSSGRVRGEHPPQAPPHQTHWGARRVGQAQESAVHRLEDVGGRTHVASQAPSRCLVTKGAEDVAQGECRTVVGQKAGEDQRRVAIAARARRSSGTLITKDPNSAVARAGSVKRSERDGAPCSVTCSPISWRTPCLATRAETDDLSGRPKSPTSSIVQETRGRAAVSQRDNGSCATSHRPHGSMFSP